MLDKILNNRKDISLLVNKAGEKNCEMNNIQFTMMTHFMHYLRNAYLQLLNIYQEFEMDRNKMVVVKHSICAPASNSDCKETNARKTSFIFRDDS